MKAHEITTDGITVWVNSNIDGSCIARFGRLGIDIHKTLAEGMACLQCTHAETTVADWETFKAGMQQHYGIVVSDRYMPRRFR